MKLLRNLGLRTKIALPFVITVIAIILIGALSISTGRALIGATDHLADDLLPAVSEVLNGDRDLYQAQVAQMAYINAIEQGSGGEESIAAFNENAQQATDRMADALVKLDGTGAAELVTGFESAFNAWRQAATSSMQLAADGDTDAARLMMQGTSQDRFDTLRDYFDRIGVFADAAAATTARDASSQGQQSSVLILTITIAALIISALLFVLFIKLIINSISELRHRLDDIAQGEGDLTRQIPVEHNDDLGQLAESFNRVLGSLREMIRTIQSLSENLAEGAHQLDQAAKENKEGVTQQTDAIAMVATAINEMQSAIEEVAGNAATAADVTRRAQENGHQGADIIRTSSNQVRSLAAQITKAVVVIRKLSEDSSNITSVLDVIRGIAEQTNLLALNAAIEAARAGEQGRGFAVVADEVRTLAQRTQKSTHDIQTMITTLQTGVSDIVSVMETGSREAGETEKSSAKAELELTAILEAMNNIGDLNTSVASATEEQTQVIDEINRSVVQINDLANESAERSAHINQVSESLAGYAEQLNNQAGRFRVQ